MMLAPQLFRDIVRPCPGCETPYDVRLHAPHMLPCSHTFCLMCLSKNDQRKKRNCLICKAKYSKFAPNLALIEVSQRLDERRLFLETETRQCDECDNRVVRSMLRQCETCEKQFVSRTEYKLECIVCLECCINSHNGHELLRLAPKPPTSSIESSPMLPPRARQPSTSSAVSVHFRHPSAVTGRLASKGIINSIKSWSFRQSSNEVSILLTPQSKVAFSEEDIVMQCQSPFYEEQNPPLHHGLSSSRYLCYEPGNPDNVSMDSVFADSPKSQHRRLMSTTSSSFHNRPPPYRHCVNNDSGVGMSPSSSSHTTPSTPVTHHRNSTQSLRQLSSGIASKIQTIQNVFGTTRVPRNGRIRMGVTDLVNTPRRTMPDPLLTSTPNNLNLTRSENSIFPPTPTRNRHSYIV